MKKKLVKLILKLNNLTYTKDIVNTTNYLIFITKYLNTNQINILTNKKADNLKINIKILNDLGLIITKNNRYYVKKHVYEYIRTTNLKESSDHIFINGFLNAYGSVQKKLFINNNINIETYMLLRKDLKKINDNICKDCVIKVSSYKRKEFSFSDIIKLSNNIYYKEFKIYETFLTWFKANITIDLKLFESFVIDVYLFYYQLDRKRSNKLFFLYLNSLKIINNNYKKKILIYYLESIAKNIPLWEYGGYSYNEIYK